MLTASLLPPGPGQPPPRDRLPFAALSALAMIGFTAILTETLPAGLLPRVAAGLSVSEVLAALAIAGRARAHGFTPGRPAHA